MVKGGTSAQQAIQLIEMASSTFYKWRFVAEWKIVDPSLHSYLVKQFKGSKLCDGLGLTKESFGEALIFYLCLCELFCIMYYISYSLLLSVPVPLNNGTNGPRTIGPRPVGLLVDCRNFLL